MRTKSTNSAIFPILFGFFVMGFVDVVGIATNYVKMDFGLSDTLANLLPMMVFLWFALFSVPTGIWMGRHGRRNTVVVALAITTLAMLIPLFLFLGGLEVDIHCLFGDYLVIYHLVDSDYSG